MLIFYGAQPPEKVILCLMYHNPLSITPTDPEPRPYKHLTDEEVLLRYLLIWTMKQSVPGTKKPRGQEGEVQPLTVAEIFISVIDKCSGKSRVLDKLLSTLFKRTAMRVFFGGETTGETMARCEQLLSRGIGVIVDYTAPENGHVIDTNHYSGFVPSMYIHTIDGCATLRKHHPDQNIAVAIKVSTLADYEELKNLNRELLNPQHREADYDARYKALWERFEPIVSHAQKEHVRAYVDAELTEINPLIRRLCYDATDQGIPVGMTVQAYLKEAPDVVKEILKREKKPGVKLVRGAYMGPKYGAERKYIWDTKEETDDCYNRLAQELYKGGLPFLTIASQNQESLCRAALLRQEGSNYPLDVAGLLGMSDRLEVSEDLPQSRYVPYPGEGSILGAISYLGRRATEYAKNKVDGGITRGEDEFEALDKEFRQRSKLRAVARFIPNVLLTSNMLPASR